MKRKKQSRGGKPSVDGYDHLGSDSDFYSGSSPEVQPLYESQHNASMQHVRKTGRHQAVTGRRKETVDPREKMALVAILNSFVLILLLLIAFFLLWKGISIYEEKVLRETLSEQEVTPVLKQLVLEDDFDIEDSESRDLFAERVEIWKEAGRLVRSAEGLIQRSNYLQAISRCQEALQLNPAHIDALEHLGELYFMQGMYVEAINSYIRLLNVDPSRADIKVKLIEVLDKYRDANAVVFMARWYLEANEYNGDIQRYLANALFAKEEYEEAVEAYRRVLVDNPDDAQALEKMADAYMHLDNYADALSTLDKLESINFRDPQYYRNIAVCHAQLGHSLETVQTLGKGAHLFGQNTVIGWIQDPRLDPVREDRTFQAFADRVGGEEFRKWLEKVAQSMESERPEAIAPQLDLPKQEALDANLLQQKK